jgi:methionyl-tRNA formyltransferase
MSQLRLVFCGTPSFAVPSFQKLCSSPEFEILAVYTQPDRPRGRGQEISFSPIKAAALAANVPVRQPVKIRLPEVEQELRGCAPDAIVIIAYGQIIPARLLGIPRLGWINLHASLLPKYRGAAPINWAIANGESVTGNTSMRIDAGMDTGEMLLQQELPIGPNETTPQLAERLSQSGAQLMVDTLLGLAAGQLPGRPQDHANATLAPMLKREDGQIDWQRSAQEIYNRMRGFTPWPGAFSEFRGQLCHVSGRPASKPLLGANPGEIHIEAGEISVACGAATTFGLTHVKLEGRKQISALEFANGARLQPGEHFGKA